MTVIDRMSSYFSKIIERLAPQFMASLRDGAARRILRHPVLRQRVIDQISFSEYLNEMVDLRPSAVLEVLIAAHSHAVYERVVHCPDFIDSVDVTPIAEPCLHKFALSLHDTYVSQSVIDLFSHASGATLYYGQEGEDALLARILDLSQRGFFVDVGAHHPIRFSNTYYLYRAGWRGVNIDATPGSMDLFRKIRPKDINIECAISDSGEPLLMHLFEEGALNTSDASLVEQYIRLGWKPSRTLEMIPRTLVGILDEVLPVGQRINVMNIDVEGNELCVLRSNDWERYRPDVIILEVLDTQLSDLVGHPSVAFLRERGYAVVSKLLNSTILRCEG